MSRTFFVRAACMAALSASALCGQFLNRAVWLGFNEEGVRRDFTQGREYFLDRLSYVVTPPWWHRGLRRFEDEADFRFGSVTSRDFTVENHLDHRVDVGSGVAFRYHYLQGENRDTRYQRNAIGLEYSLDQRTALFAQGTPLADKERIDVSFGAWLWRERDQALRLMVTMIDAPGDKSLEFEYARAPYGLHLAGAFGDVDSHRVAFELAAQLPFEVRNLDTSDVLEMQRYICTVDTHLRVATHDWIVAGFESEFTDKRLTPLLPGSVMRENFDRTFHQARIEWWRDGPTPWSVGFVHTYHHEQGQRFNDPANDLRTNRREWMAVARTRLALGEKLAFEPQLFAGNVHHFFRDGVANKRSRGFEGKLAWNVQWQFTPDIRLAIIVSTQLDEMAFGGGGAQFVARF